MKLSRTLRYSLVLALVFAFTLSLSALDQKLSAEGKKNINTAKIHFAGGRFEKALPLYESVIAENANHIDANYKVLAIKFEQEDYIFSYKQSAKVISLVDQVNAEYEELKAEDAKAAKKFFKKQIKKPGLNKMKEDAVAVRKNSYSKLYHKAKGLYEAGDYTASTEQYISLHELAPDSVAVLSRIANNYIKQEDIPNAITYLGMALEAHPEDKMTQKYLAVLYEQSGDYENALINYDKFAQLDPENIEPLFTCGIICIENVQDMDKAIDYFERVMVIDPNNVDALTNILFAADKKGDKEKVLDARKRILVLDPENVENAIAIGSLLYQGEKWQELLDFSQQMKEIDPDTASQFENLAKSKL